MAYPPKNAAQEPLALSLNKAGKQIKASFFFDTSNIASVILVMQIHKLPYPEI